ncbi:STAS domain-containing protein, partial [Streptomyces sp. NPDC041003]|uniref:STAS domain-containing protein n=1 Tax=Streptomyces sp. NPDC041003 TaxID=3155730 RepID=UPI0033E92A4D
SLSPPAKHHSSAPKASTSLWAGFSARRNQWSLDHDTAEPLRQALDTTWPDGGRLLVDLTRLDFCDSTGLNVLLRGRLAIQESGGTLELVGLHPPVARMFHITGADRIFRVHTDLEAALATSRRP